MENVYFRHELEVLNKIETSINYLYIKDDILYIEMKEDAEVDLDTAKESVAARKKLQQGKKMLILLDSRKLWSVTPEARAYNSEKEVSELSKATAFLAGDSFSSTFFFKFMLKFNRPSNPVKIFKSEEKALLWLETYR